MATCQDPQQGAIADVETFNRNLAPVSRPIRALKKKLTRVNSQISSPQV